MTCEHCRGEGYVLKSPHAMVDGDTMYDICPYCLGDGFVGAVDWAVESSPCPTCEDVGDKTCPTCGDEG
jgi:DnaJ-class molecular chaperone